MTTEQKNKVREYAKAHRGARKQISSHGAGKYSVQFFAGGKLVGDYNL